MGYEVTRKLKYVKNAERNGSKYPPMSDALWELAHLSLAGEASPVKAMESFTENIYIRA